MTRRLRFPEHAALIQLGLDASGVRDLLRDTLLALHRVCSTGILDRGDAAILSAWDELWALMDESGQQIITLFVQEEDK